MIDFNDKKKLSIYGLILVIFIIAIYYLHLYQIKMLIHQEFKKIIKNNKKQKKHKPKQCKQIKDTNEDFIQDDKDSYIEPNDTIIDNDNNDNKLNENNVMMRDLMNN